MNTSKKAIKVTKLIASQLKDSHADGCDTETLKTSFIEAVKSLSKKEICTEILQNIDKYVNKLQKYLKVIDGHSKVETIQNSGKRDEPEKTFPFNLYLKDGCQLQEDGYFTDQQKAILVNHMIAEKVDDDPSLMSLLDECPADSAVFPQLSSCYKLLRLSTGSTNAEMLRQIMLKYFIAVQPIAEQIVEKKEAERCCELVKEIKDFICLCHLRKRNCCQSEEQELPLYEDILASLLSFYVECFVLSEKSKDAKKGKKLCGFVKYVLPWKDQQLDLLLQLSAVTEEDSDLILPLTKAVLKWNPEMKNHKYYLKYVLAVRAICDKIGAENIVEATKAIPAPKNFRSWLKDQSSELYDEFPNDNGFKKRIITRYLLEDLTDDQVERLLDIFTCKHGETRLEVSSEWKNSNEENNKSLENWSFFIDTESNVAQGATEDLFFIDKSGLNSKADVRKKDTAKDETDVMDTFDSHESVDTEIFVIDTAEFSQVQRLKDNKKDSHMHHDVPKNEDVIKLSNKKKRKHSNKLVKGEKTPGNNKDTLMEETKSQKLLDNDNNNCIEENSSNVNKRAKVSNVGTNDNIIVNMDHDNSSNNCMLKCLGNDTEQSEHNQDHSDTKRLTNQDHPDAKSSINHDHSEKRHHTDTKLSTNQDCSRKHLLKSDSDDEEFTNNLVQKDSECSEKEVEKMDQDKSDDKISRQTSLKTKRNSLKLDSDEKSAYNRTRKTSSRSLNEIENTYNLDTNSPTKKLDSESMKMEDMSTNKRTRKISLRLENEIEKNDDIDTNSPRKNSLKLNSESTEMDEKSANKQTRKTSSILENEMEKNDDLNTNSPRKHSLKEDSESTEIDEKSANKQTRKTSSISENEMEKNDDLNTNSPRKHSLKVDSESTEIDEKSANKQTRKPSLRSVKQIEKNKDLENNSPGKNNEMNITDEKSSNSRTRKYSLRSENTMGKVDHETSAYTSLRSTPMKSHNKIIETFSVNQIKNTSPRSDNESREDDQDNLDSKLPRKESSKLDTEPEINEFTEKSIKCTRKTSLISDSEMEKNDLNKSNMKSPRKTSLKPDIINTEFDGKSDNSQSRKMSLETEIKLDINVQDKSECISPLKSENDKSESEEMLTNKHTKRASLRSGCLIEENDHDTKLRKSPRKNLFKFDADINYCDENSDNKMQNVGQHNSKNSRKKNSLQSRTDIAELKDNENNDKSQTCLRSNNEIGDSVNITSDLVGHDIPTSEPIGTSKTKQLSAPICQEDSDIMTTRSGKRLSTNLNNVDDSHKSEVKRSDDLESPQNSKSTELSKKRTKLMLQVNGNNELELGNTIRSLRSRGTGDGSLSEDVVHDSEDDEETGLVSRLPNIKIHRKDIDNVNENLAMEVVEGQGKDQTQMKTISSPQKRKDIESIDSERESTDPKQRKRSADSQKCQTRRRSGAAVKHLIDTEKFVIVTDTESDSNLKGPSPQKKTRLRSVPSSSEKSTPNRPNSRTPKSVPRGMKLRTRKI